MGHDFGVQSPVSIVLITNYFVMIFAYCCNCKRNCSSCESDFFLFTIGTDFNSSNNNGSEILLLAIVVVVVVVVLFSNGDGLVMKLLLSLLFIDSICVSFDCCMKIPAESH
ncbi:hypothetical protein DERF_006209 [Dermatophagoides farinae]|uniref:Uncharacterized protein n=1 Tax=Dermatophagoides farinae TaxID=6954 RepID=A0A922L9G9_DERFA|nr:hypothetical protein DERF_006209 [Dermatophagoides farinae]